MGQKHNGVNRSNTVNFKNQFDLPNPISKRSYPTSFDVNKTSVGTAVAIVHPLNAFVDGDQPQPVALLYSKTIEKTY